MLSGHTVCRIVNTCRHFTLSSYRHYTLIRHECFRKSFWVLPFHCNWICPVFVTIICNKSSIGIERPTRTPGMEQDSNTSAAPDCQHVGSEELARGKWIALNEFTYKDPTGTERKWEVVSRTTTKNNSCDAVVIIPVVKRRQGANSVVLVKQYRPPLKAYTMEFPAGLIDEGEDPVESAIRELKEETGYKGIWKHTSQGVCLDPGMTNSRINLVTLEIDGDDKVNKNPQAQPDGSEFIQVVTVPIDNLLDSLNNFSQNCVVVHSILYTFALSRTLTI